MAVWGCRPACPPAGSSICILLAGLSEQPLALPPACPASSPNFNCCRGVGGGCGRLCAAHHSGAAEAAATPCGASAAAPAKTGPGAAPAAVPSGPTAPIAATSWLVATDIPAAQSSQPPTAGTLAAPNPASAACASRGLTAAAPGWSPRPCRLASASAVSLPAATSLALICSDSSCVLGDGHAGCPAFARSMLLGLQFAVQLLTGALNP